MTDDLLNGKLDNTPQFDENKDYLAELVGEGKKFKTPQDLAKGKAQSDLYIEDMKRKQDELRADYLKLRDDATSRAKLEDLLNQLEAKQQTNNRENLEAKKEDKPVIDPKAIEDLFDKRFSEMESSRKFKENNKLVGDKLKEAYGENYQPTLLKQLETLDLTTDEFNDLAKRKPNLLLKTLGLDGTKSNADNFQAPPRTSNRSNQFAPSGAEKRTWAYYQKLKAENPKLYYDPKTNVQMFNDHQTLGDAFEDGDFER